MENLRRRTEDEKASAAKYAITRFATDIITVGDNFTRATGAVPAGAAETDPALKSLLDGVQMIEREYINVLERHGVKRIAAKGEVFSPHLHQPMMQVPNAEVPAGTILQVFQDGYTIGDRLLRAAVVTVAEGGPKPGGKAGEAPVGEPVTNAADPKPEEPPASV
jgi:molecular chaperone GrpE